MTFVERLKRKSGDLYGGAPIKLAFLGDSVTQGCFELYPLSSGYAGVIFESGSAYHEIVKKIFQLLYPQVPFSVINAGISGDTAPQGAERLEQDVLSSNPDMTVVCFGLNDSGKGADKIREYTDALSDIFDRVRENGSGLIFMTPNMIGERVNERIVSPQIKRIASDICRPENQKTLDAYIDAARALCREKNVPVCDCHANWKLMKEAGVDITSMLSNDINHPSRELHFMFAYELVKLMLTL